MLYLKWAAFLLPSFLMEIVGKVGAPILAFFGALGMSAF